MVTKLEQRKVLELEQGWANKLEQEKAQSKEEMSEAEKVQEWVEVSQFYK